jgi:GNAT superfamily N-acetyltransferase
MRYKELVESSLTISDIEYDGMYNQVEFTDDNNDMVGRVSFRKRRYASINDGDTVAELHFGVHPDYRRKGYATEMIKIIIQHLGTTGFIPFGRIANSLVHDVIEKVKADPLYNVEEIHVKEEDFSYYLIKQL